MMMGYRHFNDVTHYHYHDDDPFILWPLLLNLSFFDDVFDG